MAIENALGCITRPAGADLSAVQYQFVKQNSSGQAVVCSVAGEKALGVLQNNPTSGQSATVAYEGITKVQAAATIVPGNDIATNAAGKAVVALTTNKILGECISGGATGEIISILIRNGAAAAP
ncbi:DUF2190 family protein [Candidatus Contendibacter odensensis]|uniref:DUF2190 domain-containing protein n=1 Tax=Candidatus Contendobacter odensis Run_B_J11 TaxID=1400861 RepID=A0A7U7G900_9GAMM|nr:DUF2190 family protein [Candidatus Contendobacter odensis]CDH43839.1 conserved hypothetical protein [Candidatus Contendobacter odensis Run_B_J11]